jgi:pyruvate dehydrogenase E2 component (dihydrolipoamide acetyltransferase)
MMETVLMPKLGLTMSSGILTTWCKKEGEPVKKGEVICKVETDKITSDVESPCDGHISRILVHEEEEKEVLAPICIIEKER